MPAPSSARAILRGPRKRTGRSRTRATTASPAVEALPRLLAELALRDHVAHQLGDFEARVVEFLPEVVGDRHAHVEADQIGELERAHRVAVAEFHRLVDVLGRRDPCLDHADRFEAEADAEARTGEARRVDDEDRLLAEVARE